MVSQQTMLKVKIRVKHSVVLYWSCYTGSLGPNNLDSARQNLASSFVNGFVNAAFGADKLLMEDGNKWLYKNKDHGNYQCILIIDF